MRSMFFTFFVVFQLNLSYAIDGSYFANLSCSSEMNIKKVSPFYSNQVSSFNNLASSIDRGLCPEALKVTEYSKENCEMFTRCSKATFDRIDGRKKSNFTEQDEKEKIQKVKFYNTQIAPLYSGDIAMTYAKNQIKKNLAKIEKVKKLRNFAKLISVDIGEESLCEDNHPLVLNVKDYDKKETSCNSIINSSYASVVAKNNKEELELSNKINSLQNKKLDKMGVMIYLDKKFDNENLKVLTDQKFAFDLLEINKGKKSLKEFLMEMSRGGHLDPVFESLVRDGSQAEYQELEKRLKKIRKMEDLDDINLIRKDFLKKYFSKDNCKKMPSLYKICDTAHKINYRDRCGYNPLNFSEINEIFAESYADFIKEPVYQEDGGVIPGGFYGNNAEYLKNTLKGYSSTDVYIAMKADRCNLLADIPDFEKKETSRCIDSQGTRNYSRPKYDSEGLPQESLYGDSSNGGSSNVSYNQGKDQRSSVLPPFWKDQTNNISSTQKDQSASDVNASAADSNAKVNNTSASQNTPDQIKPFENKNIGTSSNDQGLLEQSKGAVGASSGDKTSDPFSTLQSKIEDLTSKIAEMENPENTSVKGKKATANKRSSKVMDEESNQIEKGNVENDVEDNKIASNDKNQSSNDELRKLKEELEKTKEELKSIKTTAGLKPSTSIVRENNTRAIDDSNTYQRMQAQQQEYINRQLLDNAASEARARELAAAGFRSNVGTNQSNAIGTGVARMSLPKNAEKLSGQEKLTSGDIKLTLTKIDVNDTQKEIEAISAEITKNNGNSFMIEEKGLVYEIVPAKDGEKILFTDDGKPKFEKKLLGKVSEVNRKFKDKKFNREPASIQSPAELKKTDDGVDPAVRKRQLDQILYGGV